MAEWIYKKINVKEKNDENTTTKEYGNPIT